MKLKTQIAEDLLTTVEDVEIKDTALDIIWFRANGQNFTCRTVYGKTLPYGDRQLKKNSIRTDLS